MRPVRSLAVCLALAAAPDALADSFSPDTDRILGDPAYLPLGGQVFGQLGYSYAIGRSQSQQIDAFNGFFPPPLITNHSDTNTFVPALSYGITDDFGVSANLGFGNGHSSDTYQIVPFSFLAPLAHKPTVSLPASSPIAPVALPPGFGIYNPTDPTGLPPLTLKPGKATLSIDYHFRSIGAEDPGFALHWRAVDERIAPVSVDISASYAPDIFQSRSASTFSVGKRASGSQTGALNLAISREMRLFTVLAYGTFGYDGRSDTATPYGNQVLRGGAHAVYSSGIESQIRLLPFLALNAGAGLTRPVRNDQIDVLTFKDRTFRSSTTIRPAVQIEPYVGLVFPIAGPYLVGEVLYEHDFIGDQTNLLGPLEGMHISHRNTDVVSARLRFVFGVGRIFPAQ